MDSKKLMSTGHSNKLQSMLSQLREHHILCDLTIEVSGGVEFAVHKVVLVAHSKVFKNQLDCGNLEGNRFVFSSVDSSMFGPLLHFLYTGELTISQNNIWAIITAATQLDMPDAIDLCETFLNNTLKSEDETKKNGSLDVTNEEKHGAQTTNQENLVGNSDSTSDHDASITPQKKRRGRPRKRPWSPDRDENANPTTPPDNGIYSDGYESDWKPNDGPTSSSSRKKRKQTNPRKLKSRRKVSKQAKKSTIISDKRNKESQPLLCESRRRTFERTPKHCCMICRRTFSFYSSYALHRQRHHCAKIKIYHRVHDTESIYCMFPYRFGKPERQADSYRCRLCKRESKFISLGESHRKRYHLKAKQCDQCPFTFLSAVGLFQHHKQKHRGRLCTKPSSLFRCRMCNSTYRHRNNFLTHVKVVHNSSLKCESCSRSFKPARVRNQHLVECYRVPVPQSTTKPSYKGPAGEMKCDKCGRVFKYQKAYDKHTRVCNGSDYPIGNGAIKKLRCYVCRKCGEEFHTSQMLHNHKNIQHPPMVIQGKRRTYCKRKGKWNCDICTFKSSNPHLLVKHVKDSHSNVNIPCSECKYTTGSKLLLERHVRMRHQHTLCCEICSQTFSVPAQLRVHKFVKHKIDDGSVQVHECPMDGCKYTCVWKSSLKVHMQRHQIGKPFTCDICDKKFKREKGLEKHRNKIHKRIRPYMCDICGQSYGEDAELKAHMVRHNSDKQFKCDQCPYATHDKGNFQSHMFGMHKVVISPDMAIFTCNVCDYTTDRKHRYDMHMKNHMGIRDVTCPVCNKSFVTKNTLSNHMQRVHSEKTYTCNYCQYTTGNQHTYKEHVRVMHTHRNIKPYKCAYCDFRCHTSGNCRKHCANRHKGLEIKWVRLCELYPGGPGAECDGTYPEERPMVESNIKHLAISRRISKDVLNYQKKHEGQVQQPGEEASVPLLHVPHSIDLQQQPQQQQHVQQIGVESQQQQQHPNVSQHRAILQQPVQLQPTLQHQSLSLNAESLNSLAPIPEATVADSANIIYKYLKSNTSNQLSDPTFPTQTISFPLPTVAPSPLPNHLQQQQNQTTLIHVPHMPNMQARSNHDNLHMAALASGILTYDFEQPGQLPTHSQSQSPQDQLQQPSQLPIPKHLTHL